MLMLIKEKLVQKILNIEILVMKKHCQVKHKIQRSFEQGRVETNGTEVSTILPPMSMFTPNNDRQEKKNKVIDKLLEFFDKFFSISNNKF